MSLVQGHENIVAYLERTVENRQPAHAYLFSGKEGIGKRLVAIKFACMLMCKDPEHDLDDSCPACRKILTSSHPDVEVIVPEKGLIRIDKVRSLQNSLKFAPMESDYKFILIDDAHLMNRSAQNALLKTLEEPPPNRIIVLVTSKPSLLLSTVRSRCRKIYFGPLSFSNLTAVLQRKGLTPGEAEISASISAGSVCRALEVNKSSFLELRKRVISTMSDPGQRGIAGLLELSESVSSDRQSSKEIIDIAISWIRDVFIEKIGVESFAVINRDFSQEIKWSAGNFTNEQLFSIYQELIRAAALIDADTNLNRNLVNDLLLIKICRIIYGPDLGINRITDSNYE